MTIETRPLPIVGKALRKNPERRYQVTKDLLLDLEALGDEVALPDRSRESVPRGAFRQSARREWCYPTSRLHRHPRFPTRAATISSRPCASRRR
jgi:hypothetical protein